MTASAKVEVTRLLKAVPFESMQSRRDGTTRKGQHDEYIALMAHQVKGIPSHDPLSVDTDDYQEFDISNCDYIRRARPTPVRCTRRDPTRVTVFRVEPSHAAICFSSIREMRCPSRRGTRDIQLRPRISLQRRLSSEAGPQYEQECLGTFCSKQNRSQL